MTDSYARNNETRLESNDEAHAPGEHPEDRPQQTIDHQTKHKIMLILLNDQVMHLPDTIDAVTEEQKARYKQQHGQELTRRLQEIREMPAGDDRNMEFTAWQIKKAERDFAFFTNATLKAIEQSPFYSKAITMMFGKLPELIELPYPNDPITEIFSLS